MLLMRGDFGHSDFTQRPQPCIRGMRMTVRRVVEAVSLYPDRAEFFKEYPELNEDDVRQALEFAAANLEDVIDFRVA